MSTSPFRLEVSENRKQGISSVLSKILQPGTLVPAPPIHPPGACHTFNQTSVYFSGFGKSQYLFTFCKSFCMVQFVTVYIRIICLQTRLRSHRQHRLLRHNHVRLQLHRAWNGPSSLLDAGSISFASNMPIQFFKSDNKINITCARSDGMASSFFAAHGPIKTTLASGCSCFDTSCSGNHRCQLLRNIVDHGRENISSPAWTRKDSRKSEGTEVLPVATSFGIMSVLLRWHQYRHRELLHILRKIPESAGLRGHLLGVTCVAKLTNKRRSNFCNDFIAFF